MAGTLTISTLSDGTDSTSATNCIKGSAKAWVAFNGVTTTSIQASYNVSSVTRNATGDYTVNYTNAFSDTNYCVLSSGPPNTSGATGGLGLVLKSNGPTSSPTTKTTSASQFIFAGLSNTVDAVSLFVAVFR
jgi:hypothetical protein